MTAEHEAGAAAGMVVGFVGLGHMGIPMSRRLVAAGYHVRGFDTSADARRAFAEISGDGSPVSGGGVTAVDELAAVGDGADAVILMLPDSDVVERVVLGRLAAETAGGTGGEAGGLLAALPAGSTVIDMSSSDPARTQVLAELVASAGSFHSVQDCACRFALRFPSRPRLRQDLLIAT